MERVEMPSFLHVNAYTAGQMCAAARVAPSRYATWVSRGFFLVDPAHERPGGGRARLFSLARVMQIAIAAKLIDAGVPVTTASIIAGSYVHADAQDGGTVLRLIHRAGAQVQAEYLSASDVAARSLAASEPGPVLLLDVSSLAAEVHSRLRTRDRQPTRQACVAG